MPYSVFWKDTNCVYQGCNAEFARFLGLDRPQDIIGKTDYDLPRKKSRAEFLIKCDREVIKAGVPLLNVEQRRETSNGHVDFLMNKIPLRDSRGKITGILGINIDVAKLGTEAYNSKRDMKLLNKAFSSVVDAVVIIDASNKVIRFNQVCAEIFNKRHEDLTGKSFFTLTPGQAGKGIREAIRTCKKNPCSQIKALHYKIAEKYFQVTVHSLRKADKYDGALLSFVDITDLKRKMTQIEDDNCNIRNLIKDTSHKIRTPLSNVIGFAEILGQSQLEPKLAEYTERIHTSGTEILGVINNMAQEAKEKDVRASSGRQKSEDSSKAKVSGNDKEKENCSQKTEQLAESQDIQPSGHILVVDDIPENRMLVEIILKKAGYNVTQCANGKEAVQLCDEKCFDLILMDIQMPILGGREAAQQIRSQGLNSKTIILAMTASLDGHNDSVTSDQNFNDCLSKPLKKETLLKKIWRYMEQTKQLAAADNDEDIISFLGDNPDYKKTIEMFVKNLPGRIKEMQDALNEGDIEELTRKVHALKGLGGFAGFAVYTEKAKELEQTIQSEQFENIQKQLEEMTRLCLKTKLARK
jgi:PAS domain S-box-containing protein